MAFVRAEMAYLTMKVDIADEEDIGEALLFTFFKSQGRDFLKLTKALNARA